MRMRGEERFDLARAGNAEAIDPGPPATSARDPDREICERAQAVSAQHLCCARHKPLIDVVGNLRLRFGQRTQYLDGTLNRACVALLSVGGIPKHGSQIWSTSTSGKFDKLPPDAANERT